MLTKEKLVNVIASHDLFGVNLYTGGTKKKVLEKVLLNCLSTFKVLGSFLIKRSMKHLRAFQKLCDVHTMFIVSI